MQTRTPTSAELHYATLEDLVKDQRGLVARLERAGPADRLERARSLLVDLEEMLICAEQTIASERRFKGF